ncbi:hypothetical protein ACFRCI_19210 [Streptomyces sp. NPDC056638]|uniref:hypothetical protein n=1 Tax=Streptomyces sp. NPDC056638 TaxID=3345887 RepID=UPI0036A66BC6
MIWITGHVDGKRDTLLRPVPSRQRRRRRGRGSTAPPDGKGTVVEDQWCRPLRPQRDFRTSRREDGPVVHETVLAAAAELLETPGSASYLFRSNRHSRGTNTVTNFLSRTKPNSANTVLHFSKDGALTGPDTSSRSRPSRSGRRSSSDEDRRGLTALFRSNVNPYGTFRPDMNKRVDPGLVAPRPRTPADTADRSVARTR